MKIVINTCFGGFSLSPKAVMRLAELKGKKCYFFKCGLSLPYELIPIEEAYSSIIWTAFSIPNPNKYLGESKRGSDGTYKEYNNKYNKICLDNSPSDRTSPELIKVIEELGEEANSRYSKLKIIEIPDNIKWTISDYDGMESVEEKHRSWD